MHDIIEPSHSDMPLDLAIWLPPLQAWRSVYGNGFCDEAMQACMDRLKGLASMPNRWSARAIRCWFAGSTPARWPTRCCPAIMPGMAGCMRWSPPW